MNTVSARHPITFEQTLRTRLFFRAPRVWTDLRDDSEKQPELYIGKLLKYRSNILQFYSRLIIAAQPVNLIQFLSTDTAKQ